LGGGEVDQTGLALQRAATGRVPRKGVGGEGGPLRWWEAFGNPAPPRPIDRDEAMLHLLHAEALRRAAPQRRLTAWEASHAAALVGAAGGRAGGGRLLDAAPRVGLA